jgi:hypothetical protein
VDPDAVYFGDWRLPCGVLVFEGLGQPVTPIQTAYHK